MKKIFALALALMMVLALDACGDTNKTSSDNNTSGTSQQDTKEQNGISIVNASEEAWICSATNIAYVFLTDGKYESYKLIDGTWKTNGNGTYKMETDSLTIDSTEYDADVEGNTLTFTVNGKDYAYVKTSPFKPGQSSEGNLDENLVLPDGQAWIWEKNGVISGYVFKADGTYSYHTTDTWILQSSGTWSTDGNSIKLSYEGSRTYVLNSDGLTLTDFFGDVYGPYAAETIPSGN